MSNLRKRSGVASSHTGSPQSSLDCESDEDFDFLLPSSVPLNIVEDSTEMRTLLQLTTREDKEKLRANAEEIQRLRNEVKTLKQIIRQLDPEIEIDTLEAMVTSRQLKHKNSDVPVPTNETRRRNSNVPLRKSQPQSYNANMSFYESVKDRSTWLVGLLIFQSCSSFILARNDPLLQQHPVIVHFLTMLVGAGGNAGNQASVRVIRGLATGSLNSHNMKHFLWRELSMAVTLTAILSTAGCLRAVLLTGTNLSETIAITSSLALIVFTSICLGALLPLLLQRMKLDPAHSSTTIQVVMDILGVVFTVQVSLWTLGVLLTSSSPVINTGSQLDVDAPTIAQVDDLLKKLADSN